MGYPIPQSSQLKYTIPLYRGPRAQPNPRPPTPDVLLEIKHEGASVNNQTAGPMAQLTPKEKRTKF